MIKKIIMDVDRLLLVLTMKKEFRYILLKSHFYHMSLIFKKINKSKEAVGEKTSKLNISFIRIYLIFKK